MKLYLIIIIGLVICGCSSVHVQPINSAANLNYVCILENHSVRVFDFVTVLKDGFGRYGISTEVISGSTPDRCEYILTYVASQSWDFSPYLSYAEIRLLEKRGRSIAYAEYYSSSFSLMKWQGTKAKMDPVIDDLLKALKKIANKSVQ